METFGFPSVPQPIGKKQEYKKPPDGDVGKLFVDLKGHLLRKYGPKSGEYAQIPLFLPYSQIYNW